MKKKIGIIKLMILSGKATPAPPIGPALGQRGLNILDFCKKFNDKTNFISPCIIIPVIINYYSDKSFEFFFKKSSITILVKNILKLDKFSSNLNNDIHHNLSFSNLKDIIFYKISDLNTNNFYSAFKTILGTIKTLGININF